jgi:hypothetical protein
MSSTKAKNVATNPKASARQRRVRSTDCGFDLEEEMFEPVDMDEVFSTGFKDLLKLSEPDDLEYAECVRSYLLIRLHEQERNIEQGGQTKKSHWNRYLRYKAKLSVLDLVIVETNKRWPRSEANNSLAGC